MKSGLESLLGPAPDHHPLCPQVDDRQAMW